MSDNNVNGAGEQTPNTTPEITPEIQKIIDRKVTEASKTAYNNAYEKALNNLKGDTDFINGIKSELEEEAKLSAQEKIDKEREILKKEREALDRDKNQTLVLGKLSGFNLNEEQQEFLTNLLVGSDAKTTNSNADLFIQYFNEVMENKIEAKMKETADNITKPKTGANTLSERDVIENEYKIAKENNDELAMLRCIRKASELGVSLI